ELEPVLFYVQRRGTEIRGAQVLVTKVINRPAVPLVRATLGDGVDEHAREVGLPHVARRHEDAELLDRLLRDDATVAGAAGKAARTAEVEAIVLVAAVDGPVVVTVVLHARPL